MLSAITLVHVAIVATIVLAGVVSGVAGFGFAVVGTMVLASLLDPATAVAFMIIPVVATNLTLARELSVAELRRCGRRFWPLMAATVVGTVLGMATLRQVPATPMKLVLGALSLGFVIAVQDRVAVPGLERVRESCYVDSPAAMGGIGLVGGALFGGTNVGVQLIAYLRSFDLDHGTFVGVVAMVFLGVNGLRVGAAGVFGLYPDATFVALSVAAGIPAVAGVLVGRRARGRIPPAHRRGAVLVLLSVIGVRLLLAGAGIA